MSMDQLTLWSEAAPARASASPEEERAWMESLASCSSISELYRNFARRGFSGRTSQAVYPQGTTRSGSFSGRWLTSGMALHGELWTLSSSEWPSAAAVCSLSDTLEEGGVPQRYSLTPTACAGILSRAERRGKSLPEPLASVLRAVASSTAQQPQRGGVGFVSEQAPTLIAGKEPSVLSFAQNTRDELRVQGDGDVSGALSAQPGMKQTTYVLQYDGSTSINSRGDGFQTDGSAYTLNCVDRQSVVCLQGGDVSNTITARSNSSPTDTQGYPVVCVADDNANAAMDVDMCGSLKVGGGAPWIAAATTCAAPSPPGTSKGSGTSTWKKGK